MTKRELARHEVSTDSGLPDMDNLHSKRGRQGIVLIDVLLSRSF